jgi:DNA-binding response OmpR family regulator
MARVLIVDDDVVLRDFLKSSLREDGFEVDATSRVSRARQTKYDVVLKDIERPFSLDKLQRQLKLMGLTQAA